MGLMPDGIADHEFEKSRLFRLRQGHGAINSGFLKAADVIFIELVLRG